MHRPLKTLLKGLLIKDRPLKDLPLRQSLSKKWSLKDRCLKNYQLKSLLKNLCIKDRSLKDLLA